MVEIKILIYQTCSNFYNYKNGNDLVKLSLPDKVTLVDENIDFRLKSIANED